MKDPETGEEKHWSVPVLMITATEGQGVSALAQEILQHRYYLKESGLWQAKEAFRLKQDLKAILNDMLVREWYRTIEKEKFDTIMNDVILRRYSPVEAAKSLLSHEQQEPTKLSSKTS